MGTLTAFTIHAEPARCASKPVGWKAAIRRAALLRCWDLGGRLEFVAEEDDGGLRLVDPEGTARTGSDAGVALCRLFPGLWVLAPLTLIPGVRRGVGALVLVILRQRGGLAAGRGSLR
ncbi:MAG: hypothetical protein KC486_30790 [Myxococcales bacterium]|nr:hypothetical protein [Myxococcales bacterium]